MNSDLTSSLLTTEFSCTICGCDDVSSEFQKDLGGVSVRYSSCSACGHLTASDFDSDALYSGENYFEDVDFGWERRNQRVLGFLNFLRLLPGIEFQKGSAVVDFGCGLGKLVEDLRAEYSAVGYEPFPNPSLNSEFVITDWEGLSLLPEPQLVLLVEVMEHLRNPDEILSQISSLLSDGGYVLITTEMFTPGEHNADWPYLNPAAGHVSIFTEDSIQALLARNGFQPVFRVNRDVWLFRKAEDRSLLESFWFRLSHFRARNRIRVRFQ